MPVDAPGMTLPDAKNVSARARPRSVEPLWAHGRSRATTMSDLHSSASWGFGLVQVLGWLGGLAVRCSNRGRCRRSQSFCHLFFFLTLLAVGAATSIMLFVGVRWWLLSAFTLAGMLLLALCDFERSRTPRRYSRA